VIKNKLSSAGDSKVDLKEMISSYGSLQYSRSRAQEFVAKAVEAIADLEDSNAKEALIETAKFAANRAG